MFDSLPGKGLFLKGKYKEAAEFFLEGAREGDAESAFHYGYMLMNGIGVGEDCRRAASFFGFAREKVGEANYNLAVMYLHGVGVSRDYRKCFRYMEDAARLGVIEAQLYLGVAHSMGMLYEPDVISISMIPYHTPIYRDPYMLLGGDVPDMEEDEELRVSAVRLDMQRAFHYFRSAAYHSGDYVEELAAKSKFLYARCFLDGLGVEANREKGDKIMLIAAVQGSQEAMHYISTEAPYLLTDPTNKALLELLPGRGDARGQ
ncbi:MAG: sel1 repeat family protein [Clostridia bacterium]|nr:sel1 repeat family protein [Clostridia bacterium]